MQSGRLPPFRASTLPVAPPHNGHSNSFPAYLEILELQGFWRGAKVTKQNREDVRVRRIKEEFREILARQATGSFADLIREGAYQRALEF
jgi:hypothetical protein